MVPTYITSHLFKCEIRITFLPLTYHNSQSGAHLLDKVLYWRTSALHSLNWLLLLYIYSEYALNMMQTLIQPYCIPRALVCLTGSLRILLHELLHYSPLCAA